MYSLNYVLATAGEDYDGLSGVSVVFAPGENEMRITLNTLADGIIEDTENLTATITAPAGGGVVITAPSATVSISESLGMLHLHTHKIHACIYM